MEPLEDSGPVESNRSADTRAFEVLNVNDWNDLEIGQTTVQDVIHLFGVLINGALEQTENTSFAGREDLENLLTQWLEQQETKRVEAFRRVQDKLQDSENTRVKLAEQLDDTYRMFEDKERHLISQHEEEMNVMKQNIADLHREKDDLTEEARRLQNVIAQLRQDLQEKKDQQDAGASLKEDSLLPTDDPRDLMILLNQELSESWEREAQKVTDLINMDAAMISKKEGNFVGWNETFDSALDEKVRDMQEGGPDYLRRINSSRLFHSGCNPFHMACIQNASKSIDWLLRNNAIDLKQVDNRGNTVLAYCLMGNEFQRLGLGFFNDDDDAEGDSNKSKLDRKLAKQLADYLARNLLMDDLVYIYHLKNKSGLSLRKSFVGEYLKAGMNYVATHRPVAPLPRKPPNAELRALLAARSQTKSAIVISCLEESSDSPLTVDPTSIPRKYGCQTFPSMSLVQTDQLGWATKMPDLIGVNNENYEDSNLTFKSTSTSPLVFSARGYQLVFSPPELTTVKVEICVANGKLHLKQAADKQATGIVTYSLVELTQMDFLGGHDSLTLLSFTRKRDIVLCTRSTHLFTQALCSNYYNHCVPRLTPRMLEECPSAALQQAPYMPLNFSNSPIVPLYDGHNTPEAMLVQARHREPYLGQCIIFNLRHPLIAERLLRPIRRVGVAYLLHNVTAIPPLKELKCKSGICILYTNMTFEFYYDVGEAEPAFSVDLSPASRKVIPTPADSSDDAPPSPSPVMQFFTEAVKPLKQLVAPDDVAYAIKFVKIRHEVGASAVLFSIRSERNEWVHLMYAGYPPPRE